ncbi:hypothetical protein KM92DES2_12459 [uncultured Desulfovibrio sp.]|uniref:Uncharacterized protein n=1 Tax=uncultured Desulfovibrio sp. TaxID=167968 RepID=A0A212K9C7_9BACT|nr:hypothetical protein KM92DES2_12459 [uncultured Desulfovibrio sp.]
MAAHAGALAQEKLGAPMDTAFGLPERRPHESHDDGIIALGASGLLLQPVAAPAHVAGSGQAEPRRCARRTGAVSRHRSIGRPLRPFDGRGLCPGSGRG